MEETQPSNKVKRPLFMTLLALAFLMLAVIYGFRFVQAISNWGWLILLEIHPHPIYFAITGIIWCLANLTASIVIWFGIKWAPLFCRISGISFTIWFWVEYLFISQSKTNLANAGFLSVLMLLWVISLFFPFSLLKARKFFNTNTS